MEDFDIDSLSLEDLRGLRARVDRAISSFQDRKRKEAMAAVEQAAREHGFALNELTGKTGGRKGRRTSEGAASRSAGEAKYAHPEDNTQTWSGRGRRPRWVSEHLDGGGSLEDLAL